MERQPVILLVDDEASLLEIVGSVLEAENFAVLLAGSVEKAIEHLNVTTPDIIIMDIYLKGEKNGLELAKEIHARSPIPILFLTASTKPEIISAIQDLKGCHYLSKPINSDSLEDVLMRFAQD